MKTTFLFLVIFLFIGPTFAEEKRLVTEFMEYKVEIDPELQEDEALFVFDFKGLTEKELSSKITLSVNGGDNETVQLVEGKFEYAVTPGIHKFIMYINENYYELYSQQIRTDPQEKHFYWVHPRMATQIIREVDKPVIYLYPESIKPFEVSVVPKGEMLFTYPEIGEGWQGTMHPDGTLDIQGEQYKYLFWESQQKVDALNPRKSAGFLVEKSNIVSFLEEKLNAVGFTASERADFITYWGPRMQQFDQVFVTFHQDKECDAFAELSIVPQPDNLHRFYMSWGSFDGQRIPEPQELKPFNRSGFTAIEWGGQEVPTISFTLNP